MAIDFFIGLQQALDNIGFNKDYRESLIWQEFLIHEKEELRKDHDGIIGLYGNVKWQIADLLNKNYSNINVDLYNWLNGRIDDEVSYFLNEAGSNALRHSEFKAPFRFHLWMGEKGFVIGIEQKGKGFNAELVDEKRLKDNEGRAFEFFRNCKSKIFFDDPKNSKTVFMATSAFTATDF